MPSFFAELIEHPGFDDNLARIKLIVGVVALIAFYVEASRESEGRPVSLQLKKWVGGGLAIASILSFFHFLEIGYRDFYHRHELFHYYIGAKYFPEIGYEGIYGCAAVAESELPDGSAGPRDRPSQAVRRRKLRDLRVNLLVDTTDWVDHPERCKAGDAAEGRVAFTDGRWNAFKRDVAFFRRVSLGNDWEHMQKDHGYNPPPTWALLGRFFADLHPADVPTMKALSAIDPLLFAAMFGMIAWAFGLRVTCVAIMFWGLNDAAPFYWTGGAFLRQDWLLATVASACLFRKRYFAWGGAALAYATLLRVFPVFLFAGVAVSMVAFAYRAWRRDGAALRGTARSILLRLTSMAHRRIVMGAAITVLVLVPLSALNHGTHAWPSFVHHIAVHNATPLTNHMGWKTIVAHSAEGRAQVAENPHLADAFATWKAMRRDRVARLWPVHLGGIAIFMGLFVWAVVRLRSPWIVTALSCLPAMVLIELTDYYYSFFMLAALLTRGRRQLEVALIATAIASEVCHLAYPYFDDRFVAMSVVYLVFALFMVSLYARRLLPERWTRVIFASA